MRFNHGLLFMMALALLVSFVRPIENMRGRIDGLFMPVAFPVRKMAHGVYEKTSDPVQRPSAELDHRPADKLRDEIETLKFQLAQKDQAIAELQRQLNEFNSVGKTLFDRCRIVKVTGGDAGTQQV